MNEIYAINVAILIDVLEWLIDVVSASCSMRHIVLSLMSAFSVCVVCCS